MNNSALLFPIGSFEPEPQTLETLKSLIANEATRLTCLDLEPSWTLLNYMNAYRIAKGEYQC